MKTWIQYLNSYNLEWDNLPVKSIYLFEPIKALRQGLLLRWGYIEHI